LTDSSLASILFASAGFGAGYSAGVYQQIEKNTQKFFVIACAKSSVSKADFPSGNQLLPLQTNFQFLQAPS